MVSGSPLEAEDLYSLASVSDPRISPDGGTVAYVVGTLDREADKRRSRIWLVSTEGDPSPRPFSPGGQDGSPRWSPDGRTLAYTVRGEHGAQLCLQELAGGEPRLVGAEHPAGIGGLVWSPDGGKLAFTSRTVPPGNRDRLPQVQRRLRYLHNGTGYVGDGIWRLYVHDLARGEAVAISDPDWHHFQPTWSPDGSKLACVTTRRPDWDLEWIWDIYSFNLDGSDVRKLTGSLGVCIAPDWSPDGRRVAYIDNRCPSTGTTVDYHVFAVAADGSAEPVELSGALDRGATAAMLPSDAPKIWWAPDDSGVYFTYRDAGYAHIGKAEATGDSVRPIVSGPVAASGLSLAAQTGRLAYLASDAGTPGEVWSCAPDGSGAHQLTRHTEPVMAELSLGQAESFSLTAPDGLRVESWLTLPPGKTAGDGPFPTILELHGGPHGAVGPAFTSRTQILASHGYAVVAVNFRGSGGYGQSFADVILGDWGAKEFADAMAALDHLVEQGIADPKRLGVFGGSYGGFMTNYTITHTERFAAAVTISTISTLATLSYLTDHWESIDWDNGGYPFERPDYFWEHSPLKYVTRITTPLLILHGEHDFTCSVSEADMLFAALRKQRKEVELVRYPGEAHGFIARGRPLTTVDAHRRLLDWFLTHIPVE